ncbi:hypothetical protein ILUMI_08954 [Ignelater luminosus]|uniref:Uncharacterized protein n=1 Tax=Ignelater luminosus TaxID=2038154 RepID=A0A8K0GGI9_IGNLU|nr:hypothetical protein ILUMI_08954 [Ignelater luminosus]
MIYDIFTDFSVYTKYFHAVELEPTGVLIRVYRGPTVSPKGQIEVKIKIGEIEKSSKLLVVVGATKSLLGRDMYTHFGLNLNSKTEIFLKDVKVNEVNLGDVLEKNLNKYSDLFKNELGTYKDELVRLELIEGAFDDDISTELPNQNQEYPMETENIFVEIQTSNSVFTEETPVAAINSLLRVNQEQPEYHKKKLILLEREVVAKEQLAQNIAALTEAMNKE